MDPSEKRLLAFMLQTGSMTPEEVARRSRRFKLGFLDKLKRMGPTVGLPLFLNENKNGWSTRKVARVLNEYGIEFEWGWGEDGFGVSVPEKQAKKAEWLLYRFGGPSRSIEVPSDRSGWPKNEIVRVLKEHNVDFDWDSPTQAGCIAIRVPAAQARRAKRLLNFNKQDSPSPRLNSTQNRKRR